MNNPTIITPYAGAKLIKFGRIVICEFHGVAAYDFTDSRLFIANENSEFRPSENISDIVYVWKADNNAYIGTIDLFTTGYMRAMVQNTMSTRNIISNTGHMIFGTVCWRTNT